MPAYVMRKKGRLYLEIRADGKRTWRSLGLRLTGDKKIDDETLTLAETIRIREEARLVSREYNLVDKIGGRRGIVPYAEEVVGRDHGKVHLRKSLPYIRTYWGTRRLDSIDDRSSEGYREFLRGQPTLAAITASHYFQAFKGLLRCAMRDWFLARNPAEFVTGIRIPEPDKIYCTPEELAVLMDHRPGGELGAEISRGWLFACMNGLRKSDIQSLARGSIEPPEPGWEEGEPRPDGKPRRPLILMKRQVKTKDMAGIPLNPSAWDIIKVDIDKPADTLLFPRLTESKTGPHEYFRVWEKNAGLSKSIGWHTARHTFAVLSLEAGADLYTVKKLLGHSSIKTTQAYAKSTDKMKREAVDRLPEVKLGEQKSRYKKI